MQNNFEKNEIVSQPQSITLNIINENNFNFNFNNEIKKINEKLKQIDAIFKKSHRGDGNTIKKKLQIVNTANNDVISLIKKIRDDFNNTLISYAASLKNNLKLIYYEKELIKILKIKNTTNEPYNLNSNIKKISKYSSKSNKKFKNYYKENFKNLEINLNEFETMNEFHPNITDKRLIVSSNNLCLEEKINEITFKVNKFENLKNCLNLEEQKEKIKNKLFILINLLKNSNKINETEIEDISKFLNETNIINKNNFNETLNNELITNKSLELSKNKYLKDLFLVETLTYLEQGEDYEKTITKLLNTFNSTNFKTSLEKEKKLINKINNSNLNNENEIKNLTDLFNENNKKIITYVNEHKKTILKALNTIKLEKEYPLKEAFTSEEEKFALNNLKTNYYIDITSYKEFLRNSLTYEFAKDFKSAIETRTNAFKEYFKSQKIMGELPIIVKYIECYVPKKFRLFKNEDETSKNKKNKRKNNKKIEQNKTTKLKNNITSNIEEKNEKENNIKNFVNSHSTTNIANKDELNENNNIKKIYNIVLNENFNSSKENYSSHNNKNLNFKKILTKLRNKNLLLKYFNKFKEKINKINSNEYVLTLIDEKIDENKKLKEELNYKTQKNLSLENEILNLKEKLNSEYEKNLNLMNENSNLKENLKMSEKTVLKEINYNVHQKKIIDSLINKNSNLKNIVVKYYNENVELKKTNFNYNNENSILKENLISTSFYGASATLEIKNLERKIEELEKKFLELENNSVSTNENH